MCIKEFFLISAALLLLPFSIAFADELASLQICGQSGSISARIASCSVTRHVTCQNFNRDLNRTNTPMDSYSWSLVSREADGSEVWRDDTSGILVSDSLGLIPLAHGRNACVTSIISDQSGWALPSPEILGVLAGHCGREVLPHEASVPQAQCPSWDNFFGGCYYEYLTNDVRRMGPNQWRVVIWDTSLQNTIPVQGGQYVPSSYRMNVRCVLI